MAVPIAKALDQAHRRGVIHRDFKPGNIMLTESGPKLLDFGLARTPAAPRRTSGSGAPLPSAMPTTPLTVPGLLIGTLQYMAPEGLYRAADARGDVYGLGATLYELLTLRPPVGGESPAELMKQLADGTPVPPSRVNPAVPRDLETIVLKALSREPDRRYATAGEMAADLRAFLDDRPIRARRETLAGRLARWCRRIAGSSVSTRCSSMWHRSHCRPCRPMRWHTCVTPRGRRVSPRGSVRRIAICCIMSRLTVGRSAFTVKTACRSCSRSVTPRRTIISTAAC